MNPTQSPPLYVTDANGKKWRRISPAGPTWVIRSTPVRFVRNGEIVKLPYATYRRGHDYRHLAHDQIATDGANGRITEEFAK